MRAIWKSISLPFFVCAMVLGGTAANQPASAQVIEDEYSCTFTRGANQSRAANLSAPVTIQYVLNPDTGEAAQIRNGERATVFVVRGNAGLSFVEALQTGVVNVTTITTTGNAVHSVHDVRGGVDVLAIQYYGTCSIS